MDGPRTAESRRTLRASGENCAFRPLRLRDGHVRGEDFIFTVLLFVHIWCPSVPKVLTGNIPFYFLPNPAVAAKVAAGGRPMIPVDTPVAAHKSGLWAIIQRCWEEDPIYRPALPEVRDRLFVAAGMWDDDLGRSGSTDGYVSVAQNILLSSSSGDSSDGGK